MNGERVIEFYLDGRSGVSPYMQLVQQVRRAMRLGLLVDGDQLPTVKDVVAKVAINPNTVLKAYRELFHPAERFWLFQGIETALFVALAVLLLLAAVHWVRRRIS